MTARRQPERPALFAPGELALVASPAVRLRELAARSRARPEPGRAEDVRAIGRLRELGADLARRFGLSFTTLDPERDGVNGHYGICYEDGRIRIRLRHARTRRLLKESSLVDTLCHELAHLRYLDHSLRWERLYVRILAEARRLGYYRPGRNEPPRPRQLSLFRSGACGTRAHAGARGMTDAGAV